MGEDYRDYISSKVPYILLCLKVLQLCVWDTIVAITQQLDVHISSDVSCCCCFGKHS